MSYFTSWPFRFGKALASLRTKHLKKVRKQAKAFLKDAAEGADRTRHPKLTQGFNKWLKQADLEPVFNYLTS